jgi:hypothetical protein
MSMSPNRNQKDLEKAQAAAAAVALVASMSGDPTLPYSFRYHSGLRRAYRNIDATHCAKCGGEIPPGKPGRLCKKCRS